MSAAEPTCPDDTATPVLLSVPEAGRGAILAPGGAPPAASRNPRSGVANTYVVSSDVGTVLLAPEGASFTAVTLTVIVWAPGLMSTPPFAEPPSSRNWNRKLAYAAPLASAAGVKRRRPAQMSAAAIVCPAVTATPLFVRVPAPGSVTMRTSYNASPSASLKPKSEALKL